MDIRDGEEAEISAGPENGVKTPILRIIPGEGVSRSPWRDPLILFAGVMLGVACAYYVWEPWK